MVFEDDAEEHDENKLIKSETAVNFVIEPNEAKLLKEIERLNKIIDELKLTKPVDLIPDDEEIIDTNDDEIEVINTNLFKQQEKQKVKKTQDISNIMNAFDLALKKMKS